MDDKPVSQISSQALALKKQFEGKGVRVFTTNGANLHGKAHFEGNWVFVEEPHPSRKAVSCNLRHVISITKG